MIGRSAAEVSPSRRLRLNPSRNSAPLLVRTTIVVFVRNAAIGTLVLSALSGWLLFPRRRPNRPVRDRVIAGILAVLVLSSVYQLIWLRTSVVH